MAGRRRVDIERINISVELAQPSSMFSYRPLLVLIQQDGVDGSSRKNRKDCSASKDGWMGSRTAGVGVWCFSYGT